MDIKTVNMTPKFLKKDFVFQNPQHQSHSPKTVIHVHKGHRKQTNENKQSNKQMKSKQTTTTTTQTTKAVFYCYIDLAVTQYRHKGPIDVALFPGSPLVPTKIYTIQNGFIFRRDEGRAWE